MSTQTNVRISHPDEDGVGVVEVLHGPESYVTVFVLRDLLAALRELDADPHCGAIIVRSEGKHFCAGRDWATARDPEDSAEAIYAVAPGLLELRTPWIAELTGGSIGVGMGLALCADYRVAADTSYLWPKFVRIGIHHGFGLTATLPWLVGPQRATELLSLGARVGMDEAHQWGLVDRVAPLEEITAAAHTLAAELAAQPREALAAIRETMRAPLRERFAAAIAHERAAQTALHGSKDFQQATGGGYRYREDAGTTR
ncbi:enoyl-CoA hydratase/isomerase family protein [Microbacterium sp. zg-Y818]|uniref:enoyl-CoA hydratase/isomerase family protein n=1 Tax=unclassified Microbacterium TaxID=2609290 RepID=UPI00214B6825|nr:MULTISPECIES: enoyl-CoA hydratase/isomerase family protein [unclassified Microbacterium]MCR2799297.1 enoyl-CoA hydratase/isomerase family protein [Microbacterium sp. zg.Y818]WIM21299.1 enoyl-CoA hydratase/isomerase family protein [Microbacterium sp. zg-Y818]